VLEASDGVGGRVRTDLVDGFLLDRGFQVLLTAYPEAQAMLDYPALQLRPFDPGALIQMDGARHRLGDPWRRPLQAVGSLLSPVGTLGDKLRVAGMRHRAISETEAPDTTTMAYLRAQGFSDGFITKFLQPFFSGIFLERDLKTSSRMAEFVFRMMAIGDTVLPAQGMGAMTQQLAAGLSVRLNAKVTRIDGHSVELESGERLNARAVVLATEGPEAAKLARVPAPGSRGVSCLYFAADQAPLTEPILLLNGDGQGPVNHLCVPSAVAPSYAPAGAALVSVSVLDLEPDENAVREQLTAWFGPAVRGWRHLRTYRIAHAQPEASSVAYPAELHVCGDHRESASIQGALVSGRKAAESVLQVF
jgi:phytoene dehydrogenase-like protein